MRTFTNSFMRRYVVQSVRELMHRAYMLHRAAFLWARELFDRIQWS